MCYVYVYTHTKLSLPLYIHIYIYIYTERVSLLNFWNIGVRVSMIWSSGADAAADFSTE